MLRIIPRWLQGVGQKKFTEAADFSQLSNQALQRIKLLDPVQKQLIVCGYGLWVPTIALQSFFAGLTEETIVKGYISPPRIELNKLGQAVDRMRQHIARGGQVGAFLEKIEEPNKWSKIALTFVLKPDSFIPPSQGRFSLEIPSFTGFEEYGSRL